MQTDPADDLSTPLPGEAPPSSLRVGGLTRLTSIDFPGKLAAVVFVQGCPWRCTYCHNPHLQPRGTPAVISWNEVLAWLQRRVGLLDAVVFSGGEPTVDAALPQAMTAVRELGFAVGLHSAGMAAQRLYALLPQVDWIGLDVKAPLDDDAVHAAITGARDAGREVRASLRAVLDAGIAHEVRTTAHPTLLSDSALRRLGADLVAAGVRHYALQIARAPAAAGSWRSTAALDYPLPDTLRQLQASFTHFTLRRD